MGETAVVGTGAAVVELPARELNHENLVLARAPSPPPRLDGSAQTSSLGEASSVATGRRGAALLAITGSFTLSAANRAGNDVTNRPQPRPVC